MGIGGSREVGFAKQRKKDGTSQHGSVPVPDLMRERLELHVVRIEGRRWAACQGGWGWGFGERHDGAL